MLPASNVLGPALGRRGGRVPYTQWHAVDHAALAATFDFRRDAVASGMTGFMPATRSGCSATDGLLPALIARSTARGEVWLRLHLRRHAAGRVADALCVPRSAACACAF